MKCSLCESVALYRVRDNAYCKNHRDEATAVQRKIRNEWDESSALIEERNAMFESLRRAKEERGKWAGRYRRAFSHA